MDRFELVMRDRHGDQVPVFRLSLEKGHEVVDCRWDTFRRGRHKCGRLCVLTLPPDADEPCAKTPGTLLLSARAPQEVFVHRPQEESADRLAVADHRRSCVERFHVAKDFRVRGGTLFVTRWASGALKEHILDERVSALDAVAINCFACEQRADNKRLVGDESRLADQFPECAIRAFVQIQQSPGGCQ